MGAQYFTAVSSQRALRHVGISEADYAMKFIYLKPPIPLQTQRTKHVYVSKCIALTSMHYNTRISVNCLVRDATKKNVHIKR